MSRASTALKRLGVAALVTATIGAGVPALLATGASAAAGDVISLTPDTDSASTGTCNEFTIQVSNGGTAASTRTVDVIVTERNQAASETADVTFCTVRATGAAANTTNAGFSAQTQAAVTYVDGTNQDNDQVEFTTDAQGKIVFGVLSNEPQVVDVRAFEEDDANDRFNAGEITDTPSVKTFTQGDDDAVDHVTATPASATNFTGETHTILVTAFNAQNDTVAGADIAAKIESGPNSATAVTCADRNNLPQTGGGANVGTTNNNGQTECSYIGGAVGTDSIRVFADETGRLSGNFDVGEPSVVVSKTWQAAPTGLRVDLTCDGGGTSFEDCINPTSSNSEVFTAKVTRISDGAVVSGVAINFAVTADNGDPSEATANATVSPTTCNTNASGICTTTLTEPNPVQGENITVSATIRGQNPAGDNCADTTQECSVDSGTKTFQNAAAGDARYIDLTPESSTQTAGSFNVTAFVTDQYGNPVGGVTVNFTESGDAQFGNSTSSASAVTGPDGKASVSVINPGSGTSTITATIGSASQCNAAAVPATTTRGAVPAGNCSDSETYTLTTAASPTSSPTASPGCKTAILTVNTKTINATGLASVTVSGVTGGSTVELQGYSQNHYGTANFTNDTTNPDRTGVANASGSVTFNDLRPASNTRLRARQAGCSYGNSDVINVRAQETLQVARVGTRTYVFSGNSIPARPGGLIISLYRITGQPCAAGVEPRNCPGEILIGQGRADQTTGAYSIKKAFGAADQNVRDEFVVKTGQDAQNAPGRSNARSLLIY